MVLSVVYQYRSGSRTAGVAVPSALGCGRAKAPGFTREGTGDVSFCVSCPVSFPVSQPERALKRTHQRTRKRTLHGPGEVASVDSSAHLFGRLIGTLSNVAPRFAV